MRDQNKDEAVFSQKWGLELPRMIGRGKGLWESLRGEAESPDNDFEVGGLEIGPHRASGFVPWDEVG